MSGSFRSPSSTLTETVSNTRLRFTKLIYLQALLVHVFPSLVKRLSDCEDYPAEGAALHEVTQSICRLSQRERLCHDGLDRTGLK